MLEREQDKPDFWKNEERARYVSQRAAELKEEIELFEKIKKELKDLDDFQDLSKEEQDFSEERNKLYSKLESQIKEEEIRAYLAGEYDKNNAILFIKAGTGGKDAEDWATMLLRMYQRFCEQKGFKTKILHQNFGESGPEGRIGTKEVALEVKGKFAYGFLKNETGVHRLVRISPFSANQLRHTSFSLVEVLPVLSKIDQAKIKIKPEDLKIETFKSSGPGGQNVNKRETAVRIVHLPTGIVVSCQSERFQGLNRKKALEMLYGKLYQQRLQVERDELQKIKGKRRQISWGNQIRSYILHPYQLVKDHRTGVETSNVEEVLDGNLDKFIDAEIKLAK